MNHRAMKSRWLGLFAAILAVFVIALSAGAPAQSGKNSPPAAKSPAAADLQALISKVNDKIRQGKRSEADLAPELKEFDDLAAKHQDPKDNDAARILVMKGMLYLQIIGDEAKGEAILSQVKTSFPGTDAAAAVDKALAAVKQRAAAKKAKEALVGKPAPNLTFKWASREDLKTLSELKGKVVVLDFWATWCGPCVSSFPDIKKLADHYKGYDVEVIGVTSIQGRVHGLESKAIDCKGDEAKEMKLMSDYMKAKDINWTIAFSEQEVFNPEYGVTGIPHMTIIGPDGKVSHNGIHPGATPLAEKTAMIDKLLKEANLKTPPGA
jgi:thiol-disulfide isomerase/thioredoxin